MGTRCRRDYPFVTDLLRACGESALHMGVARDLRRRIVVNCSPMVDRPSQCSFFKHTVLRTPPVKDGTLYMYVQAAACSPTASPRPNIKRPSTSPRPYSPPRKQYGLRVRRRRGEARPAKRDKTIQWIVLRAERREHKRAAGKWCNTHRPNMPPQSRIASHVHFALDAKCETCLEDEL